MTGIQQSSIYRVIPHRAAAYMVRTEANTRAWDGLWTADHLAETALDVPFRADPTLPWWSRPVWVSAAP
ncbi:MAG TPA: hypothetical protein VH763_08695 [Gemmatimonadales bacterium]|jgi:hypothetical protein